MPFKYTFSTSTETFLKCVLNTIRNRIKINPMDKTLILSFSNNEKMVPKYLISMVYFITDSHWSPRY
jgi:hypothetical protein